LDAEGGRVDADLARFGAVAVRSDAGHARFSAIEASIGPRRAGVRVEGARFAVERAGSDIERGVAGVARTFGGSVGMTAPRRQVRNSSKKILAKYFEITRINECPRSSNATPSS
jgi:hypothetical protein